MSGKRQPTDLILLKGKKHMTKKEVEDRKSKEVHAFSDSIEPPSYLPDNLKEEFTKTANELIKIGIMSNLDCEALARFIVAESQYEKVTLKLLKMKTLGKKYMDLALLQDRFFKECRQSASDLGLTISSRCRLVIPKKEEKTGRTKEEREFGDV